VSRLLHALTVLGAAATLVVTTPGLASAHGDRQRAERFAAQNAADNTGANVPLVASDNVSLLSSNPGSAGISGCFMKTKPLFVMSSLDSVKVYDVSDARKPQLAGTMPSGQFENEAMNCGERKTSSGTKRFALIGVDLYQASPNDIQHVNVRPVNGSYEMIVVDVTDPANPRIAGRAPATTSTHTVTCVVDTDCRYVYSAGTDSSFSIFDLANLSKPREVDSDPAKAGVQPFSSPTAGHKWNFDGAGYGTHTGFNGSAIFDVRKPTHPRLVTTTGAAGRGTDPRYPGWNDFIHHNSFRPNARAFKPGATPSVQNGNVLFVTEEDYEQTDCAKAGSFQTWWVKRLDGTKNAIVPLDKVELADLGNYPLPQGAFCSAHWFSYHPSGIVAAGFYGGGMQLIDVRNPRKLKSYGHATWGASEVWDSYWVPVFDKSGKQTGRSTNLVYAVDLVRGLDVYAVDLPGSASTANAVSLTASSIWGDGGRFGTATPLALVLTALVGAALLRRRARGTALA
jgi:hypothetical protein